MADFATLYLQLKNQQFNSGIDKSQGKLKSFGIGAGKVTALLAVSGTAAALYAKNTIKAFSAQEDAINRLNAALDLTGDLTDRNSRDLQAYAASLQRVTKFGDELILEQIAFGKNLGVNSNQLKDATKAAIGLAAKYKLDLKTAMMLVGRASQGQTQMLTRYGIVLGESLNPQEKFNKLLEIGASNFKLAEADAKTLSGRLTQMSNAYGDLKEVIGGMIVDILDMSGNTNSFTKDIQNLTSEIKRSSKEWTLTIKSIAIDFKASALQSWNAISWLFGNISTVFTTAGANIKNVVNFFVEAWTLGYKAVWDLTKALGRDIGNAFKGVAENIWKAIKLEDTDFTGVFANLGKEFEKEASKLKIKLPEITSPEFKGLKILTDGYRKIEKDRAKAQKILFDNAMKNAQEIGKTTKKNAEDTAKAMGTLGGAQRFTEAVFAGTVEAQKRELGQISSSKATENNTKKTADYTKKTADYTNKIAQNITKPPVFVMA